jgi:hypothetical protein
VKPPELFGAGFDFGISGWLPGSWLVVVAAEAWCFGRIFPQIGRRFKPATGTIFRKILTSLSSWKYKPALLQSTAQAASP